MSNNFYYDTLEDLHKKRNKVITELKELMRNPAGSPDHVTRVAADALRRIEYLEDRLNIYEKVTQFNSETGD